MSQHITKVENFDYGVRASCTCGWIDRWPEADGSAQQSAAAHKAKYNNRQGQDIDQHVIDELKPGTLDLTTPENRKLASDALPALVVGGMLGNNKAAEAGIEIIAGLLVEALKPSIEAVNQINTIRRKD